MSDLLHFLSDMFRNSDKQSAFTTEPGPAMDAAGLSDEEKEAVNSKDPAQVAEQIRKSLQHSDPRLWRED